MFTVGPSEGVIGGDARPVRRQLFETVGGRIDPKRYEGWRTRLAEINREKQSAQEARLSNDQVPIHPLRLCKEVRDFMDRDAILVVDGQEILNFGRQAIPTFAPGARLNSGTFGTMGVGLPFGIGAKAARSEEHTSGLQSLMRISYAVFCLKKKKNT